VTWFLPFFGDEVAVVVEMFGKKSRERGGQFRLVGVVQDAILQLINTHGLPPKDPY
jgi:hypothetical protein